MGLFGVKLLTETLVVLDKRFFANAQGVLLDEGVNNVFHQLRPTVFVVFYEHLVKLEVELPANALSNQTLASLGKGAETLRVLPVAIGNVAGRRKGNPNVRLANAGVGTGNTQVFIQTMIKVARGGDEHALVTGVPWVAMLNVVGKVGFYL